MGSIGYQELLIIFLIVLLLFGGKKIPEIARGLGRGIREFRKAKDDIREAIEMEAEAEEPVPASHAGRPASSERGTTQQEAAPHAAGGNVSAAAGEEVGEDPEHPDSANVSQAG